MGTVLDLMARALLGAVQLLPLRWVARLGRGCGAIAYALDARHRRVALENLQRCFGGERTSAELRALARENFRRIGENLACGIRTAAMPEAAIGEILSVSGVEKLEPDRAGRQVHVAAIGHFGNFELYARATAYAPGYQFATTYRALRQPALNRVLQAVREQSGCLFFERRTEQQELRAAMNTCPRLMIGFLADQHAGDRGLPLPFLGRLCSTTAAPAVFALRYGCPLFTAVCYRVALARWHIEVGDPIPTHENGQPRAVADIMLEVNRTFEVAVRRDPANWFWVHRRWKPGKHRPPRRSPAADVQPVDAPGVEAPS